MFLRSKEPSEASRKVGRGIVVGHAIWLVVGAVILTLAVAVKLATDASALWVWLQIGSVALLAGAIVELAYVARKTRRGSHDHDSASST